MAGTRLGSYGGGVTACLWCEQLRPHTCTLRCGVVSPTLCTMASAGLITTIANRHKGVVQMRTPSTAVWAPHTPYQQWVCARTNALCALGCVPSKACKRDFMSSCWGSCTPALEWTSPDPAPERSPHFPFVRDGLQVKTPPTGVHCIRYAIRCG